MQGHARLKRTGGRHGIAVGAVCAWLLFTAPPSSSYGYVEYVDIVPNDPTTDQQIIIYVGGWYPNTCWIPQGSSMDQVGNTFIVNEYAYFNGGIICFQVLVPYSDSFLVGPLPAGAYTVDVSDSHGGNESLVFVAPADPETCCQGIRGNVDYQGGDNLIDDLVYLVDWMFTAGPPPPCAVEADLSGDGQLDIADLVYMVDYLFAGGIPPADCP